MEEEGEGPDRAKDDLRFGGWRILGLRVKLNVVPQFIKNLFGNDGKNSILLEIRMPEEEW